MCGYYAPFLSLHASICVSIVFIFLIMVLLDRQKLFLNCCFIMTLKRGIRQKLSSFHKSETCNTPKSSILPRTPSPQCQTRQAPTPQAYTTTHQSKPPQLSFVFHQHKPSKPDPIISNYSLISGGLVYEFNYLEALKLNIYATC